jgi:hypothetical protein
MQVVQYTGTDLLIILHNQRGEKGGLLPSDQRKMVETCTHTHILCVSLLFVIFLGAGAVSRSTTNNATEISVPSVDDKWEYFLLLLLGLGGKK